jgi:CheY-like chemotaxis protein
MIKILVVDDEPTIATLLTEIMGEYGYEVTIAFDGRQGYELAKGGRFDLVITDVMMPYVSGHELCSRLKQGSQSQNTKVVMMSAVPRMAYLDRNCQADAFIHKPFDISMIIQILERFLPDPNSNLPIPQIENQIHYLTD